MPLLCFLLLWAVPTAHARDWPLPVPDGATWSHEDEDDDGVPDERWRAVEGGSGWKSFTTCVRHGASGHIACAEDQITAYSLFYGERQILQPATHSRAAALLRHRTCVPPDPLDPAQAMQEALHLHTPLEGPFAPTDLRWHSGRPVDQQGACLSPEVAATYPGGLTWTGEGALPGPGWTVGYAAAWPQWTAQDSDHSRSPRRVASTGALEIYQHGHALAVYDPVHDQHAWFASFGDGGGEGFKVDRWERIRGVTAADARTVEVQVAHTGGPDTLVRVTLEVHDTRRPWSVVGLPDDQPYGAVQVLDLDPGGQRCLLEGTTIEHIYLNGAALALSVDGGQSWIPVRTPEGVDGTLTALAIGADGRLTMLRHREIAGAFPLLLHSTDGGRSWTGDPAFDHLFWSLSPESVTYARSLSLGEGGAVAVALWSLWAARPVGEEDWRLQTEAPAGSRTEGTAPQAGRCAAHFAVQYAVLPAAAGAEGRVPQQLHQR